MNKTSNGKRCVEGKAIQSPIFCKDTARSPCFLLPPCPPKGWVKKTPRFMLSMGRAEKQQCQSCIICGIYELQFNPGPLQNTNTLQGFSPIFHSEQQTQCTLQTAIYSFHLAGMAADFWQPDILLLSRASERLVNSVVQNKTY